MERGSIPRDAVWPTPNDLERGVRFFGAGDSDLWIHIPPENSAASLKFPSVEADGARRS